MESNFFLTICTNSYLPKVKILYDSLKTHNTSSYLILFLCDKKLPNVEYEKYADDVLTVDVIEPFIVDLSSKYNIIELSTCLKPCAIQYLFEVRKLYHAIYLDPDIKVFSPVEYLFGLFNKHTILLTPHILTPIGFDNKGPEENIFLNYGIFNLGFIGVKNHPEGINFLKWWKLHTYIEGYINPSVGVFLDQLPINLVPIFFKNVKVLRDFGLNVAPWNLHERRVHFKNNKYTVNRSTLLKFFHFSSFVLDKISLSEHYNRYDLEQFTDLKKMYQEYNRELNNENFRHYSLIPSYYQHSNPS